MDTSTNTEGLALVVFLVLAICATSLLQLSFEHHPKTSAHYLKLASVRAVHDRSLASAEDVASPKQYHSQIT